MQNGVVPKRKVVVIAVPTLGTVTIHWAVCYSNMSIPLNYNAVKLFAVGMGVAEARNELVAQTLKIPQEHPSEDPTHIFFLDDDVLCRRFAIGQLMARKLPIVSGCYFSKAEAGEPLIFPGRGQGSTPFVPNQLIPTWAHGMGLTLIEVDVFRRMQAELDLGTDERGNPAWYRTLHGEKTVVGDEEIYLNSTEDFYFCDLAAKLGYQPHVDTCQPAFGWHFEAATLRAYPEKQWREYQEKKQVTWDTPEGQVIWK